MDSSLPDNLVGHRSLGDALRRGHRPVGQTGARPDGRGLAGPGQANPAAWDNLAKQQPTTPVGCLAGIRAGDYFFSEGWQQRYVDQAKANQFLANAVDFYERVQKNASSPLLRERATFGLARTLETQGKLVEAEKQYETLKTGTYADDATKRLEDLQKPETRAFYDHFAQFSPKPPSPDASVPCSICTVHADCRYCLLFHSDVFPAGRKLVAADCMAVDRICYLFCLWPQALHHCAYSTW